MLFIPYFAKSLIMKRMLHNIHAKNTNMKKHLLNCSLSLIIFMISISFVGTIENIHIPLTLVNDENIIIKLQRPLYQVRNPTAVENAATDNIPINNPIRDTVVYKFFFNLILSLKNSLKDDS